MEFHKTEALLNAYFEGATSLGEEQALRDYFADTPNVDARLANYAPFFNGLVAAKKERSQRTVALPQPQNKIKNWWYTATAVVLVGLGITGYTLNQPSLTNEEQQALTAFNKSREAMIMLSSNLNTATDDLLLIEQFTEHKNKVLK
ncbi:MAG: hypothetical protein ACPGQR_04120 [Marinirhabdus sp.]